MCFLWNWKLEQSLVRGAHSLAKNTQCCRRRALCSSSHHATLLSSGFPSSRSEAKARALVSFASSSAAVCSGLACTPVLLSQSHSCTPQQQEHSRKTAFLPRPLLALVTTSTACHRQLPLLGFHYTPPRATAVAAATLHCCTACTLVPSGPTRPWWQASLAWHSSACSTVCILYYTASRSEDGLLLRSS